MKKYVYLLAAFLSINLSLMGQNTSDDGQEGMKTLTLEKEKPPFIPGRVQVRITVDGDGNYIRHVVISSSHPSLTEDVKNRLQSEEMKYSPVEGIDSLYILTEFRYVINE